MWIFGLQIYDWGRGIKFYLCPIKSFWSSCASKVIQIQNAFNQQRRLWRPDGAGPGWGSERAIDLTSRRHVAKMNNIIDDSLKEK